MASERVLECRGLRRRFGEIVAVNGVGFGIGAGETYGLLGPNGAGKTTTISMIAGLLERDGGAVTVAGEPMTIRSVRAKSAIGYVPQDLAIYPDLSGRENLMFFARLYGMSTAEARRRSAEVLTLTGLADRAGDQAKHYSGGMKRRLNIVMHGLFGAASLSPGQLATVAPLVASVSASTARSAAAAAACLTPPRAPGRGPPTPRPAPALPRSPTRGCGRAPDGMRQGHAFRSPAQPFSFRLTRQERAGGSVFRHPRVLRSPAGFRRPGTSPARRVPRARGPPESLRAGHLELSEDPDHQADRPGQQGRGLDAQLIRREFGVGLPADEVVQFAGQGRGQRPLQLGDDDIELPLQPCHRLGPQARLVQLDIGTGEHRPDPQHAVGRVHSQLVEPDDAGSLQPAGADGRA